MKAEISYKHFKGTENTNDRFYQESTKLEKYMSHETNITWICSKKQSKFTVEARITGNSVNHVAKANSTNLYKSIELVGIKLLKQLQKKKAILNNKLHRKQKELVILDPEEAWMDYDEDYFFDVG